MRRFRILLMQETNNLENYANKKLNEKNCDWIVGNDVSNKKIGFDSDFNEVSIFYKSKNRILFVNIAFGGIIV